MAPTPPFFLKRGRLRKKLQYGIPAIISLFKNAMNISFNGVTISVIYENHQKVIYPLRFLIMNYNDSDENI